MSDEREEPAKPMHPLCGGCYWPGNCPCYDTECEESE